MDSREEPTGTPLSAEVTAMSGPPAGGLDELSRVYRLKTAKAPNSEINSRRRAHSRGRFVTTEMTVGIVLVALVLAAGAYFAFRPRPVVIDGWFNFLVTEAKGTWFTSVTVLRSPVVIVTGAVVTAVIALPRDRPRAWACLLGPCLALATSELVLKPAVGRTIGAMYSFPSGSTVGAAALATAAILAVPRRWRIATVVVGSVYALWMALAVVAMQWHLPTDSLAGLAYGVGVVLVVDAGAWMVAGLRRRPSPPEPTPETWVATRR
jgi:membrane-associated phospholipid phosphatase